MAFNFCHPLLKPEVSSDKVSTDGYEVTNLISANIPLQNTGFMTESFIKPPVSVTFKFPCAIELQSVFINGKVGRQASSVIEIYTSTRQVQNRNLDRPTDNCHSTKPKYDASSIAKLVGRATNKTSYLFRFENASFRRNKVYNKLPRMPGHEVPDSPCQRLYHHDLRNLREVCEVTVRVVFTAGGGISALKWVEIWGQPSHNTSKQLIDQLLDIHKQICAPDEPAVSNSSSASIKNTTVTTPHKEVKSKVIPADFLDPLTQEMMTMPVLLPSGQSVDQSTLDKYLKEEAKWGRTPNDPFTGIPYSSSSKFVPNASLKCRIDQFLLKHGDELKMQHLGKAAAGVHNTDSGESHHASRLVTRIPNVERSAQPESSSGAEMSINSVKSPANAATNSSQLSGNRGRDGRESKRRKLEDYCTGRANKHHGGLESEQSSSSSSSSMVYQRNAGPSTTSHDDKLDRSLDFALRSTLGNLPSFTKQSSHTASSSTTDQEQQSLCSVCHQSASQEQYLLPCQHLLCRQCALDIRKYKDSWSCKVCYAPVDVTQIIKGHRHS